MPGRRIPPSDDESNRAQAASAWPPAKRPRTTAGLDASNIVVGGRERTRSRGGKELDATARANDQQRILRYQNELFKLEEEEANADSEDEDEEVVQQRQGRIQELIQKLGQLGVEVRVGAKHDVGEDEMYIQQPGNLIKFGSQVQASDVTTPRGYALPAPASAPGPRPSTAAPAAERQAEWLTPPPTGRCRPAQANTTPAANATPVPVPPAPAQAAALPRVPAVAAAATAAAIPSALETPQFRNGVVPTGKAKAHDFIDIVSNLINWCTDRIKMRTISEDFFPKRALMLAWISEIWAVGCQRIGRNFELLPRIVTIIRQAQLNARLDLKNAVRAAVPSIYSLPLTGTGAPKACQRRIKMLIFGEENFSWMYKEPGNDNDGYAENGIVQEALQHAFFRHANDLGVVHGDLMNPITDVTLAGTFALAEYSLQEFAEHGIRKNGPDFTSQKYKSRYEAILKDIKDTFKPNKDFLPNYGRKLYRRLRQRAGAPDVEGPAKRLPAAAKQKVRAAILARTGNSDSEASDSEAVRTLHQRASARINLPVNSERTQIETVDAHDRERCGTSVPHNEDDHAAYGRWWRRDTASLPNEEEVEEEPPRRRLRRAVSLPRTDDDQAEDDV